MKTKTTQHRVKELRRLDIHLYMIVVCFEYHMIEDLHDKIAIFCVIDEKSVINVKDEESIYELVMSLQDQDMDDLVLENLNLESEGEAALEDWKHLLENLSEIDKTIKIALVGKYVELQDAYLSVAESLRHAGYEAHADIDIKWINSQDVTAQNVEDILGDVDGIVVPGGFGDRGIEGKILTLKYARENKVPVLGICLGMQLATVEFARNVVGLTGANSSELDEHTPHAIIDLMPDQKDVVDLGGTLLLASFPCIIRECTKAQELYDQDEIHERHRHRFEFNNAYKEQLEEKGMIFSGTSPDGRLVEMIELADHPYYMAVQFHPEFQSRPTRRSEEHTSELQSRF